MLLLGGIALSHHLLAPIDWFNKGTERAWAWPPASPLSPRAAAAAEQQGNTRESAVELKRIDVALADSNEKRGIEHVGAGLPSRHPSQEKGKKT